MLSLCVMKGSSILLMARSLQRILPRVSHEVVQRSSDLPSRRNKSVEFRNNRLPLRAADQALLYLRLKLPNTR